MTSAEKKQATTLYTRNCMDCHGKRGEGLGSASGSITPSPMNFQEIRPVLSHAERVLRDGVPGTAMPPWKEKLKPAQRRLLARYIRTFYKSENRERE
jgi:cytochrome c oxidase cbb3-type subunit 2/cytochrome c oxidase cbb3-type subunit I/II